MSIIATIWGNVHLLCLVNVASAVFSVKQPNIVFVLADDYGFNDIGFRNPAIHTPNLDKLASAGVKLENYYVQPICTPTRSQLMSGRYQIHTGLQHRNIQPPQPNCLPLSDPTVADKLKEVGYMTHIIGKWHLGFYKRACWPTHRGFDSYFGYLTGAEDYYTHTRAFGQLKFKKGLDLRDNESPAWDYKGQYSTHLFAQKAQKVIKAHNASKPLFLYLPFQAVHAPLEVPERYLEPYKKFTNESRRIYASEVTCMDEAVGNITQELKESGLWDNTLLVFSADSGGQTLAGGNNFPLRGRKGTLWEGGIHAIGFVTGPVLPTTVRGTSSSELIHVTDWFPTFVAGLAGGNLNGTQLDGFNQWETIGQGTPSKREELLHNIDPLPQSEQGTVYTDENWTMPKAFNRTMRAAIRVGDWKLITGYPGFGGWIAAPETGLPSVNSPDPKNKILWLFNIRDDPYEYFDQSQKNPNIVSSLLKRLDYYYQSSVPVRYPKNDPKANPAFHNMTWDSWE